MSSVLATLRDEAAAWCRGKNGWVRLPFLLAFVAYVAKIMIKPTCCNFFAPLNLVFHEAGHALFSYFGHFLYMLGGTLLECLMPFFLAFHFYRQREFFGIALCFGWLATVLSGVATYCGDARAMELPLVTVFGGGGEPGHDWNYLLGKMGVLRYDLEVAFLIRSLGIFSLTTCLGSGVWLIGRMVSSQKDDS